MVCKACTDSGYICRRVPSIVRIGKLWSIVTSYFGRAEPCGPPFGPDRLPRGNFGRTDQVHASTCSCRHFLNNSLIGSNAFVQRRTSRHSGLSGENRIWAHCHPYGVQSSISTGSISSPLGRDTL